MTRMNAARDPLPVILVFGGGGQLGRALAETGRSHSTGARVTVLDRSSADIANADEVKRMFDQYRPALVINAAAFTAVDAAESHEVMAFLCNAVGPHQLALACAGARIPLLHVSTDYVFSGTGEVPWSPTDPTAPLNAYGRSKLAGEWAVQAAHPDSYIFRTSWVFSPWGNNFVKSMLRLGGSREELAIVSDQHGCPTYALDLAAALLKIAAGLLEGHSFTPGIYHFCNAGVTTWFDFANAVFEIAARSGYARPRLRPITTAEYPLPAARPRWSVLDCSETVRHFDLTIPSWRDALQRCMDRLAKEGFKSSLLTHIEQISH